MNRLTSSILALTLMSGLGPAKAGPDAMTIGVLNDLSGVYSDLGGPGSVAAAEIAVEEFGPTVIGKPIKVMVVDTQVYSNTGGQACTTSSVYRK